MKGFDKADDVFSADIATWLDLIGTTLQMMVRIEKDNIKILNNIGSVGGLTNLLEKVANNAKEVAAYYQTNSFCTDISLMWKKSLKEIYLQLNDMFTLPILGVGIISLGEQMKTTEAVICGQLHGRTEEIKAFLEESLRERFEDQKNLIQSERAVSNTSLDEVNSTLSQLTVQLAELEETSKVNSDLVSVLFDAAAVKTEFTTLKNLVLDNINSVVYGDIELCEAINRLTFDGTITIPEAKKWLWGSNLGNIHSGMDAREFLLLCKNKIMERASA